MPQAMTGVISPSRSRRLLKSSNVDRSALLISHVPCLGFAPSPRSLVCVLPNGVFVVSLPKGVGGQEAMRAWPHGSPPSDLSVRNGRCCMQGFSSLFDKSVETEIVSELYLCNPHGGYGPPLGTQGSYLTVGEVIGRPLRKRNYRTLERSQCLLARNRRPCLQVVVPRCAFGDQSWAERWWNGRLMSQIVILGRRMCRSLGRHCCPGSYRRCQDWLHHHDLLSVGTVFHVEP